MLNKPFGCTILIALCFVAFASEAKGQPVFVPLDVDSVATGISGDGSVVVGNYIGGSGFYWAAETGTVRVGGNGVGAISKDGGTIVGGANDAMGRENAAIWQGSMDWYPIGSFTPDARPCDQLLSSAFGVNGDGTVIVGLGWDGCVYAHGFRWDADTGMTDLGSLVSGRASRANAISADGRIIVGWSDQATGFRQGARFVDGAWQVFTGDYGPVGEALAVNHDGSLIVGYNCGPSNEFAWLWTEETGVQCINGPVAEPNQTSMFGLSDDGRVIGGAVRPVFGPERQAVVWLDRKPVDLREYLIAQGVAGLEQWTLESVLAVSSDGSVLAGWGVGPDLRVHGYVVSSFAKTSSGLRE